MLKIVDYLNYKLKSHKNGHGIHSPFVYDFCKKVLVGDTTPCFKIQNLHARLKKDKREINIHDLGAGSKVAKKSTRKVGEIARSSTVSSRYGKLLYRIVNFYKPKTVIELGTGLGISSAYLAMGNPDSIVYSVEGCGEKLRLAHENLKKLNISNVKLLEGNFENHLGSLQNLVKNPFLVFLDGNHRKDPTLLYFEKFLEVAQNGSIFIFDDIRWSNEMEETWKIIKNDHRVSLTIDLFNVGVIFIKKEFYEKQDFFINY